MVRCADWEMSFGEQWWREVDLALGKLNVGWYLGKVQFSVSVDVFVSVREYAQETDRPDYPHAIMDEGLIHTAGV